MGDATPPVVEWESWSAGSTDVLVGAEPSTKRARNLIAGALALAVASVLVLGAVVYRDHQRSAGEQNASQVVREYVAAWNAHDADAVLATMSDNGTFAAGESLQDPLIGPVAGPAFTELLVRLFDSSVSLRTTGDLVVSGDGSYRVGVPQSFGYVVHGVPVTEGGLSLFTVVPVHGNLKIAQHVWWRPYHGAEPSMLWAG